MVYITSASQDEALKISNRLVEEKLVACANIYPEIESIYKWEGKTEKSKESVIIAKTLKKNFTKVVGRVKELHSYSCPCVVSVPVNEGNPDFIEWVYSSLK